MKGKQQRKPGPDYDLEATREKFLSTGRMFNPWARIKGLNPSTVVQMMNGSQIPVSGGELERIVLAALEKDGLLVMKSTETDQDRAA